MLAKLQRRAQDAEADDDDAEGEEEAPKEEPAKDDDGAKTMEVEDA